MADRTYVCLTLGGDLLNSQRDALVNLIIAHGLSVEWDGPLFDVTHFAVGAPLTLYAHGGVWRRSKPFASGIICRLPAGRVAAPARSTRSAPYFEALGSQGYFVSRRTTMS